MKVDKGHINRRYHSKQALLVGAPYRSGRLLRSHRASTLIHS